MFSPNTSGLLTRRTGTDKFGQPIYAAQGATVGCAVANLEPKIQQTPIRSTASASRGEADEIVVAAVILFPSTVQITELDKFSIFGSYLRCTAVAPRVGVYGGVDHYECEFEIWEA